MLRTGEGTERRRTEQRVRNKTRDAKNRRRKSETRVHGSRQERSDWSECNCRVDSADIRERKKIAGVAGARGLGRY